MPSNHQAVDSLNGYLYQVRYALYVLLANDETNYKISLEKYDDIAFDKDGAPRELIQTKHHGKFVSLSDRSVDLWKTIKVWLDQIKSNPDLLTTCRFLIVTTGTAPDNSAAALLKHNNRNEEKAFQLLRDVAEEHGNASLESIYNEFLSCDEKKLKKLFEAVEVVDSVPQIIDLEKSIKRRIRGCCPKGYEDQVMEQVEGWWFELVIRALSKSDRTLLDSDSAWDMIRFICYQYQPDNLPIENWISEKVSDEKLGNDHRNFVQQLRLIKENNQALRCAIKNYYKAYHQRSSWIRNELLFPNELENYEQKLVDEWEEIKALMEEESDPELQGRKLYKEIMMKNIPIRKNCIAEFITRGSYEMLSDKLEVGWHKDFLTELGSSSTTQK